MLIELFEGFVVDLVEVVVNVMWNVDSFFCVSECCLIEMGFEFDEIGV